MSKKIQIFYDEWCPVCKKEINMYRKYNIDTLEYIDIRETNIHKKYNLDPVEIRKHMHALKDGKIYTGVDAFSLIWKEIPKFRWLDKVVNYKLVRPISDMGYNIFALRIRPRLLEKKDQWDIK